MSLIKFECPHCKKIIEGDESLYGQQVKCPQCQGTILVPEKPVGAPPKTARLITDPPSTTARPPAAPDEEKEISICLRSLALFWDISFWELFLLCSEYF